MTESRPKANAKFLRRTLTRASRKNYRADVLSEQARQKGARDVYTRARPARSLAMAESALFDQHQIRCPTFTTAEAEALVEEHFGWKPVAIKVLSSFQDQNFRVTDEAGRRFVLK